MAEAPFLFICCQPGVEIALKRELADAHAELRFAYSRPGFVTFKWTAAQPPSPRLQVRSVFTRSSGWSLGGVGGADDEQRLDHIATHIPERVCEHLHVWQRQQRRPSSGMPDVVTPACRQFGERILRRLVDAEKLPPTAKLNCEASSGDYVLDVVMLGPNEWWMGWHQVASFGQRWPGGVPQFTPPNPMVSRAYLKMREAISWSGFPFRQGDRCIDLGSAPGGASQALLEEGLVVMGVDPAEMDPFVLAHPNFVHVRKRGADVRRREYRGYKWLVADSNVAPAQTLETLEAIVTHPSTSIQGLLITFKLANWELAQELPEYAQRVQSWGYRDVRCRQLAGNHLEVCMAALRARGIRRRRVQRVNLADQAETPVT